MWIVPKIWPRSSRLFRHPHPLGILTAMSAEPSSRLTKLAPIVILLALLAIAMAAVYPVLLRSYLVRSGTQGEATLGIAVDGLRNALRRYDPLPSIISERPSLRDLLSDPGNAGLLPFVNEQLSQTALKIGASDVYLMDRGGLTIAASNYQAPTSFIGKNYGYRPYFTEAMSGGIGRFHARGATTGERGFFFAAPVVDGDAVLGVVAVKFTVGDLEASWAASDSDIVATDRNGVVFMTSREDWLFRTNAPTDADARAYISETRQYPLDALVPLGLETSGLTETLSLARIEGQEFVTADALISEIGFSLRLLSPTGPARNAALLTLLGLASSLLVIALGCAILMQRRARIQERFDAQKATQDMLERRVAERTEDLNSANATLRREIDERRETEQKLRQTQTQLVQAGKLAALGQMSAALSHEINQPLAAVKSYADNAGLYLDRGEGTPARENVSRISQMVDRIADISGHLRNFARRPKEDLGCIPVAAAIDDALTLIEGQIKAAGALVEVDCPDPSPQVLGGRLRLQQVLVNLLTNAMDAMDTDPKLQIQVVDQGETVSMIVRDNGPGLPAAAVDQIFDPFFTTKPPGQGLGLGLSISYNIIQDFGGVLSARNNEDQGAEFTLELRRCDADAARDMAAE